MVLCQNCGKHNAPESKFCRFCGQYLVVRQPLKQEYSSPRPYAWKTDEYQTQAEARVSHTADHVMTPSQSAPQQFYAPLAMSYSGPQDMTGQYRCPGCGTNYLPIIERRVSSAGWLTFALLLVFTLIFFWVGLLMKEDVAICPVCKRRVA